MFGACLEVCLNTFWSWDPSKSKCVKKEPPKIHEKMISSPPKWLALRWNRSKWLDSWSGGFLSSVLCVRCAAGASWSIGIGNFRTKHQRRTKNLQVARGLWPVNFLEIEQLTFGNSPLKKGQASPKHQTEDSLKVPVFAWFFLGWKLKGERCISNVDYKMYL